MWKVAAGLQTEYFAQKLIKFIRVCIVILILIMCFRAGLYYYAHCTLGSYFNSKQGDTDT